VNLLRLKPWQSPFDLDLTLSCGQIFGWKKVSDSWSGVHNEKILIIKQNEDEISYSGCSSDELICFLGLDHDPDKIFRSISEHIINYTGNCEDQYFLNCYNFSKGIRILKQDPWECLISFICSANSNVPTISKRIILLTEKLGEERRDKCNTFPTPGKLSSSSEKEVRECLTGYRAPYLIRSALFIRDNPEFLKEIVTMEYSEAKTALMTLSGVGPKVADCILLFAYARFEVVPVDVRIRRIITLRYLNNSEKQNMTSTKDYSYDEIANFCRDYFGPYAGYAQQYFYASWSIFPPD
jgi:N-glycosylase/DNA lyase